MLNFKLLRGGSWLSIPWNCRSATRDHGVRGNIGNNLGFRVVCLLPPSEKELHV